MSLRDLSDQIGVSVNTLSRVERGHLPDLKNYQRLVEWLEVPADAFLEQNSGQDTPGTLDMVIRHLTTVVRDMYSDLTSAQSRLAVHMRSAKTFTPAAGTLLAEMLGEMQINLEAEEKR